MCREHVRAASDRPDVEIVHVDHARYGAHPVADGRNARMRGRTLEQHIGRLAYDAHDADRDDRGNHERERGIDPGVSGLEDGEAAESAIAAHSYDLMVLDQGLPRKGGLEVLKSLRRQGNDLPVLIATVRDEVPARVAGLDAGADDYLIKPFDLDELAARIRALLRRRAGRVEPLLRHRGVEFNPATREVVRDGLPLALTARELALLHTFMDRPGVVFSKAQLEEKLYGWGGEVESNTVEVYIHALRKKLGAEFIQNVRGVGYLSPRAD